MSHPAISKRDLALFAVTAVLSTAMLTGCSNSDQAREQLKRESEDSYGIPRTVTVYSQTGEKINSYYGRIDIEYGTTSEGATDKVDLVFFDGDKPVDRVVISGPAIVIADNDGSAEQTNTADESKGTAKTADTETAKNETAEEGSI